MSKSRPPGVDSRLKAMQSLLERDRPVSDLERLCMQRQLTDLENIGQNGLIWDEAEAQRNVAFAKLQYHWKGKWAGTRFDPEPWQEHCVIAPLFGWKRETEDGIRRRFTVGYEEIPRKNGKTFKASFLASQGLIADRENGPEVYSAATTRDQAAILFKDCKGSISQSPQLSKFVKMFRHAISCERNQGTLQPVSADYNFLQGKSPSRVIVDELHAHKTRDVWDALLTGMGARLNPLLFAITTAGFDRTSICWEQHEFARKVLEGHVDEPTFFCFIACADAEDDYRDPRTWWKANPNLDISVQRDFLERESRKAESSPAYENTFRRLHLNQWTEQAVRWIPMDRWDACVAHYTPENLAGRVCFAGLDLAATRDVNALVLVFPEEDGTYLTLPFFWIPRESIDMKAAADRREVIAWAELGHIRTTDGNTADVEEQIPNDIVEILSRYDCVDVAIDPHGSGAAMSQKLVNRGIPLARLTEFRQSPTNYAAPCQEFERLILSKKLKHDGNPVLRWMVSNVSVKEDYHGRMMPAKDRSAGKIDGVVALLMGLARAIANEGAPTPRYYEDHEVESF